MTYRFTKGSERWKVDPLKCDQLNRWQLYHAVNEAWQGLRLFPSAEAAMSAVGNGNTGVDCWDEGAHDPGDFTPDKWSAERW